MKYIRKIVRRIIRPILLKEPNFPAKYLAFEEENFDFALLKSSPRENLQGMSLPVPPRNLWVGEGYGKTQEEFLSGGREHVSNLISLLKDNGIHLAKGGRFLEFGCASGRLIRCFADLAWSSEFWGVDISAEHIYWCQKNLSPPFNFCITTTSPHLPFEDRNFDFIFAGSVFTHIVELTDAWLLELRRVLSLGKHLYITVLDKHSIDIVKNRPQLNLAKRLAEVEKRIPVGDGNFDMFTISRSYTLYDIEYLKNKLRQIFEILVVKEEIYGFQTGILLRKPK